VKRIAGTATITEINTILGPDRMPTSFDAGASFPASRARNESYSTVSATAVMSF
jgi:hypothetical protein